MSGSKLYAIIISTLLSASPLLLSAPVSAQTPTETIRLSTNLVVVDAQVLNRKSGAVLNNLTVADFELYEDGVKQEITHFSQDKLALSVILLIDLSASVNPVLTHVRDGALEALNRLKETDEVAVMFFSDSTQLLQDFTTDRKAIVEKLGRIEMTPVIGQGTLIYRGLREAAQYMSKAGNPASRRAIVVITDNISWDYYGYGLSEKEVSDQVIESGSMICGLIVEGSLSQVEKMFRRDKDGKDVYRRRMTIDSFADQTGGELIKTPSLEVAIRLAQLIEHLRTRYSIGFSPKREQTDGRYHRINVSLTPAAQKRVGEVLIRTKQGYYARSRS